MQYSEDVFHPLQLPLLALKPWRLVPELDGFSDRECRAFVLRLSAIRIMMLTLAFPIALLVGIASLEFAYRAGESLFGRNSEVLDRTTFTGRLAGAVFAIVMLTTALTTAFLPYCVVLRRALMKLLRHATCPFCRYSLLGLTVDYGAVRCPECGKEVLLAEHGLTPDDILAGAMLRPDRASDYRRIGWMAKGASAYFLATLIAWVVVGSDTFLAISLLAGLVASGMAAAFATTDTRE